MPSLADAIRAVVGGPSVNDGLKAYYIAGGAVGTTLPDLERSWLFARLGISSSSATNQDLWSQYLSSIPYSGNLQDQIIQFWANGGAVAPVWSPATLFASGEQGVWYDPSDFSTMFQDSAGTTPVTAVGQPVGKILDKSGRGNHASQSTAAARPVLQQDGGGKYYLAFDGVDDKLQTVASVDLSANDSMLSIVGIRKDTDSGVGHVVAFGDTTLPNDGSFFIAAPVFSAPTAGFYSRGTALSANNYNDASIAAPWLGVCTGIGDISADQLIFRTNGVQRFNTASDQGSGNYGVWPLHIGNIPTYPFFQGRMYSILIRGGASTAQEISDAEAYAASKTGVTL